EHLRAEHAIPTAIDAEDLPAAFGAYGAKVGDSGGSKKARSVHELLGLGFQLIEWDGFQARPIVDAHGRIVAVLAGQPRGADYAAAALSAFDVLEEERKAANFRAAMATHRRGGYVALHVGLSYGKGQRVPSWLDNGAYNPLLERLLANPSINRLATFASAAFGIWAPTLYDYYRKYDQALRKRFPLLPRTFPKSVFSSATFNFG
ncbi:hypothetical protein B0H15DRAFT_751412, partial [Mycena belliarum]